MGISPPYILIVDDDDDIRTMLVDLLEDYGYPVRTAHDGVEALHLVTEDPPSLVILDLWMPALDGRGFTEEVHRRGIALPIVLMTAAPNPTEMAGALHADGVLQKPFELYDLLDTVQRLYPDAPAGSDVADETAERPPTSTSTHSTHAYRSPAGPPTHHASYDASL